MFLYEKISALREYGAIKNLPEYIADNLKYDLREYQKHALENFIAHHEKNPKHLQVLFHMATGSGKTLIMAGLMIYLYKQGYRNFLFFVNLTNILDKTRENFLNPDSAKYLFANEIIIEGERIKINAVENFQYTDDSAINICFETTQALHTDMWSAKENSITFDDCENQKIVMISDEAHHLNVDTKMTAAERDNHETWESTVTRIFESNAENILLEFTATCDINNPKIRAAYEDKIIFDYPLQKFYGDKFSKDIITLRADFDVMSRAIQAIILNQYRLKIFQDNRLGIKPIILFKSAKIADSKKFMADFLAEIKNLTGAKIEEFANIFNSDIMRRAFKYFADKKISYDILASELREDFSEQHCISVNDDTTANNILNSLENADNPYRAIFEVKKLDEGWDVLNLFDIVRLYETHSNKSTLAEAQLIGRGARYCPFKIDSEQSKFRRKYDDDMTCELRICETLYYHCQNDSKYISELKKSLREIGLNLDENIRHKYILKESFKADDLYKRGVIYVNRKVSADKITPAITKKIYHVKFSANDSATDKIMTENLVGDKILNHTARIKISETDFAIVNKAMRKYHAYKFNNLKRFFPDLKSMREFITDKIGDVEIKISCDTFDRNILYSAIYKVLGEIKNFLTDKNIYMGTKNFYAKNISEVFHDKIIMRDKNNFDKIDLSAEDWFAYTDNLGTSEEKNFLEYFKGYVEDLRKIYSKIYLVRNEREVAIYNFEDGARFEPDFILFLQKADNKNFEYLQIFIEPKGDHLLEYDGWKEDFLLRLKAEAEPIKIFVDDDNYKIFGLHFYNTENLKDFDSDFKKLLEADNENFN